MLLLAADENFNNDLIRGVLRRKPDVDIVRVQDTTIAGADDPAVLAWAAAEGRVLLTHDVTTLTNYAYQRLSAGQPMPGVFAVSDQAPLAQVIEDILLLVECSLEHEWDGRILYVPLRGGLVREHLSKMAYSATCCVHLPMSPRVSFVSSVQ